MKEKLKRTKESGSETKSVPRMNHRLNRPRLWQMMMWGKEGHWGRGCQLRMKMKLGGSLIQPTAIIITLQCASDEKWQQQPSHPGHWLGTASHSPMPVPSVIGWQCNSGAGCNKSSSTVSISDRCSAALRSTLSQSSSAMPPLSPLRQRFTLCWAGLTAQFIHNFQLVSGARLIVNSIPSDCKGLAFDQMTAKCFLFYRPPAAARGEASCSSSLRK